MGELFLEAVGVFDFCSLVAAGSNTFAEDATVGVVFLDDVLLFG